MEYSSAEEVLRTLTQAYYENRDIETTLSCVTDDIEWIGTEDNDSASGKPALRELLKRDLVHYPDPFGIEMQQPTVQIANKEVVLFTILGKQKDIPGITDGLIVRGTVCCIHTESGWLVNNVHTSTPSADKEKQTLELELQKKTKQDIERFQLVLNEMNAAIIDWDLQKKTFYHSSAYQQYAISQCNEEDILNNRGPLEIVHPDDIDVLKSFFMDAKSGKEKIECTLRLKLVAGGYRWCQLIGLFYKDEAHTIGIIIDVDKEHETNIQMNHLMNTFPGGIGIFVFADTLRCNFYSDGFSKMAGLTRAEMDKKIADNTVLSSLIAPVDFSQIAPILAENTAKGLPLNMTYRYVYKDGSIRWLHLSAEKMGEEDGYPVYCCAFTTPTEESIQYRNITEDSANGVAVFDRKNRNVLYINSAAVQNYGLTDIAETLGKSFVDILKERQLQLFLTEDELASLKYDAYSSFHVEREEHYYAIRGKLLEWNHVDSYILYITDETAEYEKEQRLERLLNQVPGGIAMYRVDEKGVNQTFVNQGFYRTFRITKEQYADFAGFKTLNAANRQDWWLIKQEIDKIKNGANECDIVYRSAFPGMETMWVRLIGTVSERQGDAFTLYAAFMDVTQQVLVKNRQKELFDTIPSGILEFFYDGTYANVLSANHTLMDMIGYSENEFTAVDHWTLSDVVYPEDYHLLVEARERIRIGDGMTYDFRLLNKKTGVYRWISCNYTITDRTDAGIKVISAFLDVDDKRKLEDASAAKSRFLSRMSHEIRTPINAIMGIAELTRQDVEANAVSKENLERYSKETLTASQYLLTLVNDILDTSRIENNQIELQQHPVQIEPYLAEVHTLVEPLVKAKNIHFVLERKTKAHEVYIGDGVRVKQIIVNLINNAIKFTPPGGTVQFTGKAIHETEKHTTLQFTVSDNGIGMSKEFMDKLFTPFSQENSDSTSPFTGTGLGLSIAKNLAIKMGGDITCESEKGKGTTFTVTIVVGNTKNKIIDEKAGTHVQTAITDMQFDNIRILVCEDHPLNQKITKALLERKKCIVEIAADGVIGVDLFEKSAIGYYSMILMDIRMPNMDGLQATKEIRSLDRVDARTIPIVAMSANAYDEDVEKSKTAGMNAHLAKPVDAVKLYQTIAHYTQNTDATADKQLVLVVDDVEVNRVVISKTLRMEYHVLEAENGVEALKLLEKNPGIIAVITDVQMPVMDGVSLIKSIRAKYCYEDLAILVSTQYGDAEQEKNLIALGADDFTYKPTSPTLLAIRLKNILARRKHIL